MLVLSLLRPVGAAVLAAALWITAIPGLRTADQPAAPVDRITVVDSAGKPIAAAAVRRAASAAEAPLLATTDAEGVVRVATIDALRVEAAGYVPWEGAPGARITLLRPSSVDVRVLDAASGKPIVGGTTALLAPEPKGGRTVPASEPAPLATATTDKEGRARFTGLRAGPYRVRVQATAHVHRVAAAAPGPEATDAITVQLEPATVVTGVVRDGKKPVAAARLLGSRAARPEDLARFGIEEPERDRERARPPEITTDAAGRFRYDELAARRRFPVLLVALAQDGRWGVAVIPPSPSGAGVPPGDLQVDFDLSRAADVAGRVTHGPDRPAAGVRVVAEVPHEWEGLGGRARRSLGLSLEPVFEEVGGGPEAFTGPDGAFVIPALPAGEWRLVARPEGRVASEPVDVDTRGGSSEPVTLVLPPGRALRGTVVDGRGSPVAEALVIVDERGGPRRAGPGPSGQTRTAADGTFELSGLGEGMLRLVASAEGYGRKEMDVGTAESVRVVLSPTGSISGRVVSGATGEPLTRFVLGLAAADPEGGAPWGERPRERQATSEDGTFTMEDVPSGRWSVVVVADGFVASSTEPVDVQPGVVAHVGDVALGLGAILRGSVVDADSGAPVVGASVRLDGLTGRGWAGALGRSREPEALAGPRDTTDVDGRFALRGIPPGEFSVVATHDAYPTRDASAETRISVPDDAAGREIEATLRLRAGGSVHGVVVDAGGAPVAGAWVEASLPRQRGRAGVVGGPVQTGPDGTFTFAALPSGTILLRRGDRVDSTQEVQVKRGETTEVVLRESGARVTVRVLVGERVVPSMLVVLSDGFRGPSGEFQETHVLEGVPAGDWDLMVQAKEPKADGSTHLRRERASLQVPEGQKEVARDLRFEPTDFGDDVTLHGEVRDADTQEGLEGFVVTARAKDATRTWSAPATAPTRAGGAFDVQLAGDGEHVVNARPPPQAMTLWQAPPEATVVVEAGVVTSGPVVMLARRRLQLLARVLDVGGQPAVGARCALVSRSKDLGPAGLRVVRNSAATDARGVVIVTADEPGTYDLLVVVADRLFTIVRGVEPDGSEVTVRLPHTGTLVARGVPSIDLEEGWSGSGWWIRFGPGSSFFGLGQGTGGEVTVHGLPPGAYRVKAGTRTEEVEVVPGQTAVVELGSLGG